MSHKWTIGLVLPALLLAVVAWTDGPPISGDFTFTGANIVSEGNMSSGIMDLPGPAEENDAEAELDGAITNSTPRKIFDLRIWCENEEGEKLKTPIGGAPVSGLRTAKSQSGSGQGGYKNATFAGAVDGIATFNLAEAIPASSTAIYEAQVEHFVEPNNYKIKMARSSKKAAVAQKHYEDLGAHHFTVLADEKLVDAVAPSIRSGIVLDVGNHEPGQSLQSIGVAVISNALGLQLVGAEVLDHDGNAVSGATVSIAPTGRSLTVGGLSLSNPNSVALWLDTNLAYDEDTALRVTARY